MRQSPSRLREQKRENRVPTNGGIFFIDRLPVVGIDGEGVNVAVASGELTRRERWPRSLWRQHLEAEIVRLHEYEMAERADRGRVLPFERNG